MVVYLPTETILIVVSKRKCINSLSVLWLKFRLHFCLAKLSDTLGSARIGTIVKINLLINLLYLGRECYYNFISGNNFISENVTITSYQGNIERQGDLYSQIERYLKKQPLKTK